MKKIIYIISFLLLSLQSSFAQNNFITRMIISAEARVLAFETNKIKGTAFPLQKLMMLTEPVQANDFDSFISGLPEIRLKGIFDKKKTLFTTEFSFSDILENTFNSIDPGLLNPYDESVPELFKDAPFLFKLKFLIRL